MKLLAILFGILALATLSAVPYALWHRPLPGRYQLLQGSYTLTLYDSAGTPSRLSPTATTLYRLDTLTGQVEQWESSAGPLGQIDRWIPFLPRTNLTAAGAAAAPASSAGTPPPANP